MKAVDIISVIEKMAPLSEAASWDRSGVQVAGFQERATQVAVMLDPSLPRVEQALAAGADFILSHHPLSMTPRFPDQADDYLRLLSALLGSNAWLYSAHTSLDANPCGPVRWLAESLGLTGVATLEATGGLVPACGGKEGGTTEGQTYGFGFTGTLPHPLPYGEFCRTLADVLGKASWHACGPLPGVVRRVGCCPGSGSSLFALAAEAGVDVFITGDVKYHAALEAPLRALDVGHFCLEEEMMRRFALWLGGELSVPVRFWPAEDPLAPEKFS